MHPLSVNFRTQLQNFGNFVKGAGLSVNSIFYMSLKLELDALITCNLLKFGIILGAKHLLILI